MTEPNVGSEYLSAGEAATTLRVSPKPLIRWADAGRMPHVVTPDGYLRFSRAEIAEMVRRLSPGS